MEEQKTRDKQAILQLYDQVLPALAQCIYQNLAAVIPLFENFTLERRLDTWTRDPASGTTTKISLENGNVQQLGVSLRLEGFNRGGLEPFDITKDLRFRLTCQGYTIGPDKGNAWLEKGYLQGWEAAEYEQIAGRWSEELIEDLTQRLNSLGR